MDVEETGKEQQASKNKKKKKKRNKKQSFDVKTALDVNFISFTLNQLQQCV